MSERKFFPTSPQQIYLYISLAKTKPVIEMIVIASDIPWVIPWAWRRDPSYLSALLLDGKKSTGALGVHRRRLARPFRMQSRTILSWMLHIVAAELFEPVDDKTYQERYIFKTTKFYFLSHH